MPCDSCLGNVPVPAVPLVPCSGCQPETAQCQAVIDTSCVFYTGAALNCIGISGNICLEEVLQKIDSRVCEVTGDFTGYDLDCLRDQQVITTEQEFAEAISAHVCKLQADLTTFSNVTFPTAIQEIQSQLTQLDQPTVNACEELDIDASDNVRTVLHKLAGGICVAMGAQDVSGADWGKCFTLVGDPPTTIVQGFNTVIDYICTLRGSGGAVLPVFDNTGSCLTEGTAGESLVSTLEKIKSRLCATPVFSSGNLSTNEGCSSIASTDTLEQVTAKMLTQIGAVATTAIRGVNTSQFVLTAIDPQNPCLGQRLSLQANLTDRMVAATASDNLPGPLADKLVAGSNITLDATAQAGKIVIAATGGIMADEKVKSSSSDSTAGYLQDKITGSQAEVTIATSLIADKVQIAAAVDYNAFIDRMLDMIEEDEDIKGRFCSLINACPSPCEPPSNVQIIQVV